MAVRTGRVYKHPDPAIERSLSEIYQLIQQRQLSPESIDTRELAAALNREPGGLWKLLQLGKEEFWRIVVGATPAPAARTGIYVNSADGRYTTGMYLDFVVAPNLVDALYIDMPASSTGCLLKGVAPSPSVDPIQVTVSGLTAKLNTLARWVDGSSGAGKRMLARPDKTRIRDMVAGLDIEEYEADWQAPGTGPKHIGPTAEQFHAATGLGSPDGISALDVASIAIRHSRDLEERVEELASRVDTLKAENDSLTARVAQLEAAV